MNRLGLIAAIVCLNALAANDLFFFGTNSSMAKPSPQDDLVPGSSVKSLKIPDDLDLDLLLSEPRIANPLYLNFDERGRLWVVQYRQYPWPAGLKLVSRDNVWRNVYEPRFPPPPPHEFDSPFRGRDTITIHEDVNGDGTFDKHSTFLEGLNLATAALKGRGGVFVMNPPYLLFYADADNNDVPDSLEPRILLSGFGIEDTHSIANNLRWGPDGWIYGTEGSTVSAAIVRHGSDNKVLPDEKPIHSMGQNIWRYHPETLRYEIFAEGGGNAFGVEFDSKGRVFSGHNGGDTRGFHYVQGGYYLKNFGKHGALSNPFAYGFYPAMKHNKVERFTHTFEIYEATSLPFRYHGKLFGLAPHIHYAIHSEIGSDGSTLKTRDIGKVIVPADGERDNWFTPVDIQTGPDGALYIADWYSEQASHIQNHQGKTSPDLGRVYRLRGKQHRFQESQDLTTIPTRRLIDEFLAHENRWYRETAIRVLGARKDPEAILKLQERIGRQGNLHALEALWALYQCDGLDEEFARRCLAHPDRYVRAWTVRLLGDNNRVELQTAQRLAALAETETSVEVRLQLASTARRLPPPHALPLITSLLQHSSDVEDPFVPQMIWWAIEQHADDHDLIYNWIKESGAWTSRLAQAAKVDQNLIRRFATIGTQTDLAFCARLINLSSSPTQTERLAAGFSLAFQGRTIPSLPTELVESLAQIKGHYATALGIRRGDSGSINVALDSIADDKTPIELRIEFIRAIGEVQAKPVKSVPALLNIIKTSTSDPIKAAALIALGRFDREDNGREILRLYPSFSTSMKETAQSVLSSRASWAQQLVLAVESGAIDSRSISQDTVLRLQLHPDMGVRPDFLRHFPNLNSTTDQFDRRIEVVQKIVQKGNGRPIEGQNLYHSKANCGKCHQMFGKGGDIGPDLTSHNRSDIQSMLRSIIQPSAEIREGYENLSVLTDDGRIVNGFKVDENDRVLVLRGADGQSHTIEKERIDEQKQSKISLMPTDLLSGLSDVELRDLCAFLTSTTPPK